MVSRQSFHLALFAIWKIKWAEAPCCVSLHMMAHANKKGNTMKEKHRFNPGATLDRALLVEATGQIEQHDAPYQKLLGEKTFYYKP